MGRIVVETAIRAPQQVCFDLARDVSVHAETAVSARELVMAPGRLLHHNQRITFEARHLGRRHRLTVQVVEIVPPEHFLDEQISGPFVWMQHLHEFEPDGSTTIMRDTIHWKMPYGIVGGVADRLIVTRQVRRFVSDRASRLKHRAEMAEAAR